MRRLVLCMFLVLVMTQGVLADEPTYSLTVRGEAVIMAVPDEAVVYLSIQTKKHRQRSSAKQEMDTGASTLVRYLIDAGVPERKFKTTQRRVSAVYDYSSGQRRRTGYTGYQRFEVVLALENADELLEHMPSAVGEDSVAFRVSNARELRDQTVDLAIDDALDRAKRRADKLGITLGPVIGFQDSPLGQARAQPQTGMRMMAATEDASPQLPAGENALRVNISVTFRIEVPE